MTTTENPSIFTKIINREIPGFIPYQDDVVAVLISLEGHPMVIPKIEYRDIFALPEDVAAQIMKVAVRVAKALKDVTNCDGVNIVQSNGSAAGQEVFHFHLHIKPRFVDDTVVFKWDTATKSEDSRRELNKKIIESLST
jgi:histidine triad (HIT) family protein